MTHTGTQNRGYAPAPLMVTAVFEYEVDGVPKRDVLRFNWNDRAEVRNFAQQSDRVVRMGGWTRVGGA